MKQDQPNNLHIMETAPLLNESAPTQDDSQVSFMDLPRELRDTIYHALCKDTIICGLVGAQLFYDVLKDRPCFDHGSFAKAGILNLASTGASMQPGDIQGRRD